MISSVHGTVAKLSVDSCVIKVGGIGLHLLATPSTLASLAVGAEASLESYLAVKEDSLTLFGFSTESERIIFETLLSVNGIGAKTALSILAVYSPEEITSYAHQGDDKAFTKVPGIGSKGARRIVLELADKLVVLPEPSSHKVKISETTAQVLQGLIGLGWNKKDSQKALEAVLDTDPSLEKAPVSVLLRATLAFIGKNSS